MLWIHGRVASSRNMDTRLFTLSSTTTMTLSTWLVFVLCALTLQAHAQGFVPDDYYQPAINSFYSPSSTAASLAEERNQTDNRKPFFVNCKGYNPRVKEEQPPNLKVIQVQANDPDPGQEIEYSFVKSAQERLKFRIDPKTGEIYTTFSFDRDEPIREKELYVTVRATDNGRPPLDDVCTFKVIIEDINDNPPVFDKSMYEGSIAKDTQVGKVVMRVSATDLDDGENNIVKYELRQEKDYAYFDIDVNSGQITLNKTIDRDTGKYFDINIHAYNINETQEANTNVRLRVIESNRKSPSFIDPPVEPIYLKENFNNYSQDIVTLHAISNADKPEVIFELVTGRTEQTNSKKTFVFNQNGDEVSIMLGKSLDYESITDYTLTMSVKNVYDLQAVHVIKIKIEDVNDNIPYFTEVTTGTISENEPAGTPVMQVRAFDMDGTSANNIVQFRLADHTDLFQIDADTGNITALQSFDREEKDFYNVKVIATDNSPSSLYSTGLPNEGQQVFRISIADKNDHKPKFQQAHYTADKLPEDANNNFLVIEVTAVDVDTASDIEYTITDGNIGDAFKIEPSTGKITVNNKLDYETITNYSLTVRAWDGKYDDYAGVSIKIEDVNDNPPVFMQNYYTTIREEEITEGCILNIEAYDPDIKDRSAPQNIKFSIVKQEHQSLLSIDSEGCLRQLQPLDRDPPNGFKRWQIYLAAVDENGDGLKSVSEVEITLIDINDNAPVLSNVMPVVWTENQLPGKIVELTATDNDEAPNNGPFVFSIADEASDDIAEKFAVEDKRLLARTEFDREEQKEYFIPINICDNGQPRACNVSHFHVIIGDVNDNPMSEGSSRIFVYNYKGESPDTLIGRVYVNDPDDWDLPEKKFAWKDGARHQQFDLNADDGMIEMLRDTEEGEYMLYFTVVEEGRYIPRHQVDAEVIVTVKVIPEEAVDKSGSIRFVDTTAEDFIATPKNGGLSPKDHFHNKLAELLNVTKENVDVFTVLNSGGSKFVDVRFSAHGSPYYAPEKLNGIVGQHQEKLESDLQLKMLMVNIDECLEEKVHCESSCVTKLHKSEVPLLVYTNQTSFVGVNAFTKAECECQVVDQGFCMNGGTRFNEICECPVGFEGPNCQQLSIGFTGAGYALYKPISPCESTNITLEVSPRKENGLIMYVGPLTYNERLKVQDYMSLELIDGHPVLIVDYGTGSIRIHHKYTKLRVGKSYTIDIVLQKSSVEMTVDNCRLSTCMSLEAPLGPNEFLNVNGPLQLGGAMVDLPRLAKRFSWTHIPTSEGFFGCIRNLTINRYTYNLGEPRLSKNVDLNCQHLSPVAVAFGTDSNFWIAIIVCLLVLMVLILAVVVHKKQHDGWAEKDTDDIRETIINYEDEGGGERDTDYDLNVFPVYEDKPYKMMDGRQQRGYEGEMPDIGGYLVDKKDSCDKDNDEHEIDDLRHYGYEGDGNSTGSLSSLASCTDDGDLNFDYLSNFGPRFRKLADMYGEEPSDEDSNGEQDEGWRI